MAKMKKGGKSEPLRGSGIENRRLSFFVGLSCSSWNINYAIFPGKLGNLTASTNTSLGMFPKFQESIEGRTKINAKSKIKA